MAKDDRVFPGEAQVKSYTFFGAPGGSAEPPPERTLDGLEHVADPAVSDWLMLALTTFGESVASIVPGHFEAYARVYHPVRGFRPTRAGESEQVSTTWKEVAAAAGVELSDLTLWESIESYAPEYAGSPRFGNIAPDVLQALVEHLGPATTTPDKCYFALWEGYSGTIPFERYDPSLYLPSRAYHVFRGDISGALVSFQQHSPHGQSASLWWPADHAWCVASEIDFQWSYVGGPRSCIDAILKDGRIESTEVEDATAPFRR